MHFDRHFHCHHRTASECDCCPPPYPEVVIPPHSIHSHSHHQCRRHRTDESTSDESDSASNNRHRCHHSVRYAPKESGRHSHSDSCHCAYSYNHSPQAKHTYCHQICATHGSGGVYSKCLPLSSSSSVDLHCHAHHRTKAEQQHCISGHGQVVNHPHDCRFCGHSSEESVLDCSRGRRFRAHQHHHRQRQQHGCINNHGHNTRLAQRHQFLRAWGPPLPAVMMNCGHVGCNCR